MSKYWKTTIALFALSAILWWITIVISPAEYEYHLVLFAILTSILCIASFVIAITKKYHPDVSSYVLFGVTDLIIGIGVSIYAVYDILTDVGWFAGLFGVLLLISVIPIVVLLLIIDILLYWIHKKKGKI